MRIISFCAAALLIVLGVDSSFAADSEPAKQPVYRIMPVGDSITEGNEAFGNYRYPLWEKLYAAGYLVEYVGSRQSESRIGNLAHEGYSGKTTEFLATAAAKSFKEHPADIVLLHSGHNHMVEEMPVEKIVAATESLIKSFRAVNPKVTVLAAQVITAGKLPKYEYIPDLNAALEKMAIRLNTEKQPVILVNQADGWDWHTDTVDDHVHPNAQGAEKMATKWFAALTKVLDKPPRAYHPDLITYKKASGSELKLHVFKPQQSSDAKPSAESPRPAIVFFFGGGWKHGTPLQFYPECTHFAEKGLVAVSADYRIAKVNKTTPFESVADGKSAIRWLRQHAKELNVDPDRIVAAGASAGGQVAAATATLSGFDEKSEDAGISSRPNAQLLLYPVLDNGPEGYGDATVKARYREFSPLHNVSEKTPPALVLLGTKDPLVPVKTIEDFQARMKTAGVRCDVQLFAGAGHPIYEYRAGDSAERNKALAAADVFLKSLGYEK